MQRDTPAPVMSSFTKADIPKVQCAARGAYCTSDRLSGVGRTMTSGELAYHVGGTVTLRSVRSCELLVLGPPNHKLCAVVPGFPLLVSDDRPSGRKGVLRTKFCLKGSATSRPWSSGSLLPMAGEMSWAYLAGNSSTYP
jgi:hypothetical protein